MSLEQLVDSGYGGSVFRDRCIINAGTGYTPSSGDFEYAGILWLSWSWYKCYSFFIKDGVANGETIIGGGIGYQVGDIIMISIGSDLVKVLGSISTIFGNNELNILMFGSFYQFQLLF